MRIALIDSGINPYHRHVQRVEGGVGFVSRPNGKTETNPDFSDHIGHGTAIAGVIREKVPDAKLYALKIFHEDLRAPGSLLLASLKWAVSKNFDIIHLSLGTENKKYEAALETLCRRAFRKNILIVAAARSVVDCIFPGVFKTVIGAYWDQQCGPSDLLFHPDNAIEFGACGYPRQLPGVPKEINFKGSSFAAARVTAEVAGLLTKTPDLCVMKVREKLKESARKVKHI
jgi:subtilisin family serine protease